MEKERKKLLERLGKQEDTALQNLMDQMVNMVEVTGGAVQAVGVVGIVEKVVNGLVEKERKELLEMLVKQKINLLVPLLRQFHNK